MAGHGELSLRVSNSGGLQQRPDARRPPWASSPRGRYPSRRQPSGSALNVHPPRLLHDPPHSPRRRALVGASPVPWPAWRPAGTWTTATGSSAPGPAPTTRPTSRRWRTPATPAYRPHDGGFRNPVDRRRPASCPRFDRFRAACTDQRLRGSIAAIGVKVSPGRADRLSINICPCAPRRCGGSADLKTAVATVDRQGAAPAVAGATFGHRFPLRMHHSPRPTATRRPS